MNNIIPIWCKCRFIDGQRIICEAHEIDKLREEVKRLKTEVAQYVDIEGDYWHSMQDQRAEIKRLRTALNQYSEDEILLCAKDAEINRLKAELDERNKK